MKLSVSMEPRTRENLIMNIIEKIAVLLLVLGTALVVAPGVPCIARAETLELTLEEAIELGLSNNASVKSARLAVEAAEAGVSSAKALNYPDLSVGAVYTHVFEDQKSFTTGLYQSSSDPISLSADLSQNITTFGKARNSIRLARESVASSVLDYEEERRSLIVNIKRAFYQYLLAREILSVQQESLAYKEDALSLARERYESGLVPDYEVLQAESDLESFKPELIDAQNQVTFAELAVRDILGIDRDEEVIIVLVGNLEEPASLEISSELLMERALAENSTLQQRRQALALQQVQVELSRVQKRPSIVGFARYGLESGYDPQTGKAKYWGTDAWDGNLTAGVSVQMPLSGLFPWSGENADITQSSRNLEKLSVELESTQSSVRLTVHNALLAMEKQESKITSGRKYVQLAQRLYESARERYNNGLITSLEFQDAQMGLNSARLSYLQAVYDYRSARFELMDAIGVSSLVNNSFKEEML
jgi:outer membrane protein